MRMWWEGLWYCIKKQYWVNILEILFIPGHLGSQITINKWRVVMLNIAKHVRSLALHRSWISKIKKNFPQVDICFKELVEQVILWHSARTTAYRNNRWQFFSPALVFEISDFKGDSTILILKFPFCFKLMGVFLAIAWDRPSSAGTLSTIVGRISSTFVLLGNQFQINPPCQRFSLSIVSMWTILWLCWKLHCLTSPFLLSWVS